MIIILVILKTDLVECQSMFGTNYISLREVTRLELCNDQVKLFTENAYYPLANEVAKGYINATFRPSVLP